MDYTPDKSNIVYELDFDTRLGTGTKPMKWIDADGTSREDGSFEIEPCWNADNYLVAECHLPSGHTGDHIHLTYDHGHVRPSLAWHRAAPARFRIVAGKTGPAFGDRPSFVMVEGYDAVEIVSNFADYDRGRSLDAAFRELKHDLGLI
jgi:hypothetical protein